MKLRLFFLLIIAYVIAAFGWLTYSLVNFSNKEYRLQNQVLNAGRQACVLRLLELGKSGDFKSDDEQTVLLQQVEMRVDTNRVHKYLRSYNYSSYLADFVTIGEKMLLEVMVSPSKRLDLSIDLKKRTRLYLFQSILLTMLVGFGIYGVYYSVSAIYNLNKQQNNFLLSVTHEFKTPIAAMKLMLQTIRSRDLPLEKRNELLDKAIINSDRLNELTENMLTAMQIENDRYQYAVEEFSISDMMNKLFEHYRTRNEMTSDIEQGLDFVGDRFVLRISINNLVENAIKYSENQPVHVSLKSENDKFILKVEDQGIGIPTSEKKKIFRRFYRIQDEETRETKGTGLGLFIVKQTIRKHGGFVKIDDNSPKGTIVTVELPQSQKMKGL